MNEYETAVLRALAKESEFGGWYKIEQRLSTQVLRTREYLPDTLRRLVEQALIEESPEQRGRYRVTARGRAILDSMGPRPDQRA